ncbi:MAG: GTPase ObgE [Candidatus Roizmanbacteria bacterium]
MLADEARIIVVAGHGGKGNVSFFPGSKTGPAGGDGGNGGDIYVQVNTQMTNLNRYLSTKKFMAENGGPGDTFTCEGKGGKDLILEFPPGTSITDARTHETIELTKKYLKPILICKGGKGGRGNEKFKSATHRSPRESEPGLSGEERELKIVMKLIADVGLIGLPNAGKSSLLNELTRANVKTANYPFTTLEPNLGVCDTVVLADIPGLIEGASNGRGLGTKFLKHIEKVGLIIHCVSVESVDPLAEHTVIINELKTFNEQLAGKEQLILLTKIDLVTPEVVNEKLKTLKHLGKEVLPVSIHDFDSLEKLKGIIKQYA